MTRLSKTCFLIFFTGGEPELVRHKVKPSKSRLFWSFPLCLVLPYLSFVSYSSLALVWSRSIGIDFGLGLGLGFGLGLGLGFCLVLASEDAKKTMSALRKTQRENEETPQCKIRCAQPLPMP